MLTEDGEAEDDAKAVSSGSSDSCVVAGAAAAEASSRLTVVPEISTILVDPPRAGLDATTLALCGKFDRILYISCNPTTLEPALRELLATTHRLERVALFDHFPYTQHVECGVLLVANQRRVVPRS
jgi:tRNA/tmRNA/rRNA uracil-C5-methylase (TrmA/RlmC/RlmD family)